MSADVPWIGALTAVLKKYRWAAAVVLAGLLLMALPETAPREQPQPEPAEPEALPAEDPELLPDEQPFPFRQEGDRVILDIKDFRIFDMFRIETK